MHDIALHCVSPAFAGEIWTLRMSEEATAALFDARGQLMRMITGGDAPGAIQLPDPARGVMHYTFHTAAGPVQFRADDFDLRQKINAFYNHNILSGGAPLANEMRDAGMHDVWVGTGAILAGFAISIGTYMLAASNPHGGTYVVTWGLVVWGIARGIRGVIKSSRVDAIPTRA